MSLDLAVIIGAIMFIAGSVLTLHYMGKRPINVNVNAHAEAHGGSANVSSARSAAPEEKSGSGANVLGIIKALVIAGIVLFCLAMGLNIMNKINQPAQVIVNVPTQVPVAPPIVNVPKAEPPTINVMPQAPVVNVPVSSSPLEAIVLIAASIGMTVFIVFCLWLFRRLRDQAVAQHAPPPIQYIKTDYGWTPAPDQPISVEEVPLFRGNDR